MNAKPPFENMHYDPSTICWGVGNRLMGPNHIATIKLPCSKKQQSQAEKQEKQDFENAKELYEKYVNKGIVFTGHGKGASEATAVITAVNFEKQYICFNASKEQKIKNAKINVTGPKGKMSINGFIAMLKSEQIRIISLTDK